MTIVTKFNYILSSKVCIVYYYHFLGWPSDAVLVFLLSKINHNHQYQPLCSSCLPSFWLFSSYPTVWCCIRRELFSFFNRLNGHTNIYIYIPEIIQLELRQNVLKCPILPILSYPDIHTININYQGVYIYVIIHYIILIHIISTITVFLGGHFYPGKTWTLPTLLHPSSKSNDVDKNDQQEDRLATAGSVRWLRMFS